MLKAISNTSPLLYLYRIGGIEWLPRLFHEIWIPETVKNELQAGRGKGYDVPNPDHYSWLKVVSPKSTPSEWLAVDLGAGEIAVLALALENPERVVYLDDMLARRSAQAAGLGNFEGFTGSKISRHPRESGTLRVEVERFGHVEFR